MENSPERLEKIREMVRVVQEDALGYLEYIQNLLFYTTLGLKMLFQMLWLTMF